MSTTDYEEQLYSILEGALAYQAIEAAFFGLLLHPPDEEESRKKQFLESFSKLWKSVPQEHEGIMQSMVVFANEQKTQARIEYIYDLVQVLVENGFFSSRKICEAILSAPKLLFTEDKVWHLSFGFVLHFLARMDYKSIRTVFSLLLNKVKEIPEVIPVSKQSLLDDIRKTVALGIDRNSCLLPSYFVVNELYKLYPVENFKPHWAFGQLFHEFTESFKPLAQIVSVTGRSCLLPVVGHTNVSANGWKLDPTTLKFPLKGSLPYREDLIEPQKKLLRYVIAQPYSRDTVCNILGLNRQQKQRCPALEELFVDLIVVAMERTENENEADESNQLLWQHLSSQLIFFVLFEFTSFSHMVLVLHEKLSKRNLHKGRDQLMWVLLQYISGSVQRRQLNEFLPVMKLFDLLYPNNEPLPVPDISKSASAASFAMACMWVHLSKKAQNENITLSRAPPVALQRQLEYLKECLESNSLSVSDKFNDYRIVLLCNTYSTNPEHLSKPMSLLVDSCYGNDASTIQLPGGASVVAASPTVPCPVEMLDSLTVHAKMSLIHNIVQRIIKQASSQPQIALAPALVETYSRLLVYMEIELLGIKGFISQLLPNVFKSQAWGILHTLLEMFSYRLHHIQSTYRVTLLCHLHSLTQLPVTEKSQLHSCFQSTALRLIMGFGNTEVQPQLSSSRLLQDPGQILSKENEELNRVLILTIARAMHITGAETLPLNWCEGVIKTALNNTPHRWPSHTLSCFPKVLQQFYEANSKQQNDKEKLTLSTRVEEGLGIFKEHDRWLRFPPRGFLYFANKNDIWEVAVACPVVLYSNRSTWELGLDDGLIGHDEEAVANFGNKGSHQNIFLCIVWRLLVETGTIPATCHRVLMDLGPRAFSAHIRLFADFLVYEFSVCTPGKNVNKCIKYLNDMVWKYNIFPLDRLVLSMALRHHEGNEAQVCFLIIQLLLLKQSDFRNRVVAFVKENSPDHWNMKDWHQKHMIYHQKFPERYHFEGLLEANNMPVMVPAYLPVYFGNVSLQFLPVFDIVIHRCLEAPPVSKLLETLLEHLGSLYKFHDRPITYLYNTLHYYEQKLSDRPLLKKKLVSAITGAQKDCKPPGWSLSQGFIEYLSKQDPWNPDNSYYVKLFGRLVDTISGKTPSPFPPCDWRFNEFPNLSSHALHVTCVELLALPKTGYQIGQAIFDMLYLHNAENSGQIIHQTIMPWINAVALVLTFLPEPFWSIVNTKVVDMLQNQLAHYQFSPISPLPTFFNFTGNQAMRYETEPGYVLAIFHAVWHHASIGQFALLPKFLRELFKPLVKNEAQLLYLLCLYGPFFQRLHAEKTRCVLEAGAEFYYIIEQVCQNTPVFFFPDTICDFLYHLKYMFVGDEIRDAVEKTVGNFNEQLRIRLRFMTVKREETAQT